jgi:gliding motility-associated lipoprotein GldH
MKIIKLFIVLLIVLLSSCGRSTVYHTYQPVSATGWQRTDTLFFPIPTTVPAGDYTLEVGIRHHEDYAYRDLWLAYGFATTNHPDTAQLILAYESGNWHGHGAAGLYQFTQQVPGKIHLTEERTDTVLRVVHVMRDKALKGIRDVGIRLIHE